jgi:hypothetical protein
MARMSAEGLFQADQSNRAASLLPGGPIRFQKPEVRSQLVARAAFAPDKEALRNSR